MLKKREEAHSLSTNMDDNKLMSLFVSDNDQYAFERLYHKYKIPLLKYSFGFTKNTAKAEEMVHETFLKVYRFKTSYKFDKSFKTWLWTICKNTNLDQLSSAEREMVADLEPGFIDTIEDQSDQVLDLMIRESDQESFKEMLMVLPVSQREALLLWSSDEFSFEEMSVILKKSPQAVKNLVHRAKAQLKLIMEKNAEKKV